MDFSTLTHLCHGLVHPLEGVHVCVEDPPYLEDGVGGGALLTRTVLGVDVLDDLTKVFRHPLQLGVELLRLKVVESYRRNSLTD